MPTDTPGFELRAQHPGHGRRRARAGCSHAEVRLRRRAACRRPTASAPRAPASLIAQERLGPGPHPPLHALDRHLRARLRPDVRARRHAASSRPASRSATRQIVQAWIAESRAEIDAARLLVLRTAWTIDRAGRRGGARRDLADQVPRRRRAAAGARPRDPGARRARHHRRHAARLLVRATSAARASTTAPTRSTRSSSPGASSSATAWRRRRRARMSGAPTRRARAVRAGRGARRRGSSRAWLRAQLAGSSTGARSSHRAVPGRPLEPDLPRALRRRASWCCAARRSARKVKTAHDMGREFRVLSRLSRGLSAGAAAARSTATTRR